jgi:hypothetical protein
MNEAVSSRAKPPQKYPYGKSVPAAAKAERLFSSVYGMTKVMP